ncbi:MAG TPA: lamin tail domain-containing protein [Candidatus Saccharimonas sp.]|nr:lamin tail domain-containing protein [Candidatus Saccharimonas sp.]
MKKVIYILLSVALVLSAAPAHATDQSVSHIVIAALQTGQTGAAGNDFIVLYNPTVNNVDVTGWKIQYRSASAIGDATWITKKTLACNNATPDCRVIIAANAALVASTYTIKDVPAQPLTSGFSDSGGQIRLWQPASDSGATDANVVDMLGYGNAAIAEGGTPAAAPATGQMLVRKNVDGFIIDTNANASDFVVGCMAVDATTLSTLPKITECKQATGTSQGNGGDGQTQSGEDATTDDQIYLPLTINELLPDPASPATDAADEFIELYNPNEAAVNLAGYALQTGSSFQNAFTFDDQTVGPGEYAVVYSSQSHLSLVNSGTPVRLLDPNSAVVDSAASYSVAKTGQAWARTANDWQWSTTPTPGAANIITQPIVAATTANTPSAPKVTTKKIVSTPVKTTAPKATKTAVTKSTKVAKPTSTNSQKNPNSSTSNDTINYLLFGLVGAGIASYVGYEYRYEIIRASRKVRTVLLRQKQAPQTTPQLE